jgi:uncharacterized Tic20 family protein
MSQNPTDDQTPDQASPQYPGTELPSTEYPGTQYPGPGQTGYTPAPPAPMSAQDERTWGMLSHVIPLGAMVASAGTLGFVGSLVVYLVYKDRGPFVRAHAANSLNIQLTTLIALIVSIPLMFVLVGFLTFGAALVAALVLHVMGAIKATNGEWWNPPLTIRFVK